MLNTFYLVLFLLYIMTTFPIYWITPWAWTIDTSFEQGSGFDWIAGYVLSDWEDILVWGDNWTNHFNKYNWLSSIISNETQPFIRFKSDTLSPDALFFVWSNLTPKNLYSIRNCILTDDTHIYLVWWFTQYWNNTANNIVKLKESDMSLVLWNTWTWFSWAIFGSAWITTDHIILWNSFARSYNWSSSKKLLAINKSDLTLDTSLTTFLNPNSVVNGVFTQSDWKIILCWSFSSIAWISKNRIVRFNSDWTLDTTFNTNIWSWAWSIVSGVRELSDWRLVVCWWFTTFNWVASERLIILNNDWTINTSFTSWADSNVSGVVIDSSDNIYIYWLFTSFGWTWRNRTAKLNSSWVLDWSWHIDCNNQVNSMILKDNFFFLLWMFTTINSISSSFFWRCDINWNLTNLWIWLTGSTWPYCITHSTNHIYMQTNSSFFNNIKSVNWDFTNWFVRINNKWLLTKSYNVISQNWLLAWSDFAKNWNDYFFVWLTYTPYNISTSVAKVSNWVFDSTFAIWNLWNYVRSVIYDNWIIIAGDFTTPNNGIVKYDTDGVVDSTFDVWTWFNGYVNRIIKHSSWNYICVWDFTTYKWVTQNGIVMLDTVWTVVSSFDVWTGITVSAYQSLKVLELSNWNILVYWNVLAYKWVACQRAIILTPTWDIVPFLTSALNNQIQRACEKDWVIYMVWNFTTYGTTTVNRICWIKISDWTLVNIFWTGLNNTAYWCTIQSWNLVVTWAFTTYNWQSVGRIVRIHI